ncbi:hypothetical protein MAV3388_00075 [Mycobacterium avium subsp. hominissuis 3388]|nr:hypothetical protein MAV3388_00075 [Mycobacterium avium subsp. hominissuis 3388]
MVDERGLPVDEVEQFLNWLRAVDRSVTSRGVV